MPRRPEHRPARRSPLRRIAALLALTPALVAADGESYLRVVMEAPAPSPFAELRYEVMDRGPAVSAVHRRALPGHAEQLHAMGLLTQDEAQGLREMLRREGALTLPDALTRPEDPAAITWRVELALDGKTHRFRVSDPINQRDRRYWRVIDATRRLVKRVAGELPFRNVFFEARRMGWLTVRALPTARVFVDGFDTKLSTPLYSYEVESGRHTIRLVTPDGTYDRTYRVRVDPAGTTHLAVDLR